MKKENLFEYKKKISELISEEKKDRYLYVKKIMDGEILGPMTGYPSIDMPWLKFFSKDAVQSLANYSEKNESMYQTLYNYAKNHMDDISIDYFGVEITYAELMKNIDNVSNSLIAKGVTVNEIVPIVMPNCPETRYLIYACSKIGAIPNPIMPTTSEIDLETIIQNTNCTRMFLMEGLKEKFSRLFERYNITNLIEISPLNTSTGLLSVISNLKNRFKETQYDLFLKGGVGVKAEPIMRSANDIALIEQTGGTTALTTKSVLITNGNVLASNFQLENGELNFKAGDSLLDILLPSISYGAAFEHLTLCNGIKNYMIPTLVKKDINKKISKFKPNHILMGPIHFEFICKCNKTRKWGFIKNIVSGGDSMSIELERNSNEKLRKNGSLVNVEQGYGESECFGACACNHNSFIKEGSVGIPHLLTNMGIFKYDDSKDDYSMDEELPVGEQGEICISSPVVMKGYLNNHEATNLVLKSHSDGTVWLHTGDIGYIDNNGYVFITDRIKDLIFRNGFKVSPQKINKMITENFGKYIQSSAVVGIHDDEERNVPIFFYKLKDEYINFDEDFRVRLNEFYLTNLSEVEIPKDTISVEFMPRTSAGKIDKKVLRERYIKK